MPEKRKRRKKRTRWRTQEKKEKKCSEEHWPVIKSASFITLALCAVLYLSSSVTGLIKLKVRYSFCNMHASRTVVGKLKVRNQEALACIGERY